MLSYVVVHFSLPLSSTRGMTCWSRRLPTTTTFFSFYPPSTLKLVSLASPFHHIAHNNPYPFPSEKEGSNLLAELNPSFVDDPRRCTSANNLPLSRVAEQVCLHVLSACRRSQSLKEGARVHSPIVKLGLHDHLLLCNNLLSLYSRFGRMDEAQDLFDELLHRDVVTWTAMMSAYVRGRDHEKALWLFRHMLFSGCSPNEFTFSTILCCCTSLGEFDLGTCSHARMLKSGFGSGQILASVLMDFYSKHGKLEEALEIFTMMEYSDMVSWTTIISAFVLAKDWQQAWNLYCNMIMSGVRPSEFTFVNLLVACGCLGFRCGRMIHAHIILWGVELNLVLKTALVNMYAKCLRMADALKVLSQTPESDVMLWTAVISGYNQVSDFREAVSTFSKMNASAVSPNAYTYAGILSTCSSIIEQELGKQIHSRVVKTGLEHDVSVGNALMDMYAKCSSDPDQPKHVFRDIISPNVVSWTTLIAALGQHWQHHEAFSAFLEMRIDGLQPNAFTISSVLKACGSLESLNNVRKLHGYILKTKFGLMEDETIGNSLLDAYSRVGELHEAWEIFNKMPRRDAITYTSLAKGMNHNGLHSMALSMIHHMPDDNIKMDSFILPCFLAASSGLAAMEPGKQLHCYSIKSSLDSWISVSNGLIDMYGKCGSVSEARLIFAGIPDPNVVSWNGLISGLASNGYFSNALSAFEDMRMAGGQPDKVTFLLVLYACSHSGLVDMGLEIFNSMRQLYCISPQLDHYICLVDLLGRAGRLEEAVHTIDTMPFRPDALVYKTLLGSCKLHQNLSLGESMARNALALDSSDPAIYVLLSNMYDDAGKTDYAKETRRMMREQGVVKCPGQSWIEMRSKFYLFTAGDTSNPWITDIHRKLESLEEAISISTAEGQPRTARKPGSLHHSEKLALAFGLLNVPSAAPIRIIKNLRTCEDCHTFMELSSRIVDREIIMRDSNRFHVFSKGRCSCGGYW